MAAPPAPKGLGRLFVRDDIIGSRRDDGRDAQVRQLSSRVGESAGPVRLDGVKFVNDGSAVPIPVDVAHKLGREPRGFRVINIDNPLAVSKRSTTFPDKHIRLTCAKLTGSAAGDTVATADVEVW